MTKLRSDRSTLDTALLERRRELVARDLGYFYELTIDLFKWALKTSLALNGVALLALTGITELRDALMKGPVYLFGIGLFLALVSGIGITLGLSRAGNALFKSLWRGDDLDIENYDDLSPNVNHQRASAVGAILLLLSIVSFVIGGVWTGYNATNLPTDTRAMAINKK